MATKNDVLKALFPAGIPVERIDDLPSILAKAQGLADLANFGTTAPGFTIVPGPEVPDTTEEPEQCEDETPAARAKRKFSDETVAKRAAATAAKAQAAIDHMMDPRKRFHPLSWLANRYHISYADLHKVVVARVEAGEIELYAEDGDLAKVEFIRRRAVKARRFAPGVEARSPVPAPAAQNVLKLDPAGFLGEKATPANVDDDVLKMLKLIEAGDATRRSIAATMQVGEHYVDDMITQARERLNISFEKALDGTLSISETAQGAAAV